MIAAMEWRLGDHRGAQVVKSRCPNRPLRPIYWLPTMKHCGGAPNARLLLVTQASNRTGLVMPGREIVAMARQRGVDTVVDVGYGIACLD